MSTRHLITTTARRRRCPTCNTPVYAGHSEGLAVAVDTTPLDLAAEITARLAGRATYDLATVGGTQELWARDSPERVQHRRWPVLADHPHPAARRGAVDPAEQPIRRTKK
jgi:hypothetical protein